jgi:HNH endonuclease
MHKRPRKLFDWAAIQAFIDAGNGYLRCNARFGIAHAAWKKTIALGNIAIATPSALSEAARRRYNWAEIQAEYDAGATYRECKQRFGFASAAWTKAVKTGRIIPRPRKVWTAEEAIADTNSRLTIKRRLLKAGIILNRCDWCGLTEWRGRPLSIQIDHVNGIRDDHRLENLRMLCPNCHSQTDTFAARNIKSNGDPGSSNGRTAVSDIAYRGSSP